MSYVLDTNIFNRLLDNKLQLNELPSDAPYVASYVQLDELTKTSNGARRDMLLARFKAVASPNMLPTETFLADISRVDIDKVGGGHLYNRIKDELDSLNKSKRSNIQDALIGETAITNDFTLITTDGPLTSVVKSLGGKVRYFDI